MNTSARTSRHSFLIILPVLLAVSGSLLAQPSVTSLSFAPASVNTAGASAPVTITFSATGQGVYYFATAFLDSNGNFIGHQVEKQFTPTNSVTDSVVITLAPFSPPGTWSIAYLFVADANGFVYLPDPASVSAAFPNLGTLAVTSVLDTTPPNLTSFTLTPAAIDTTTTSADVTVGFTLSDDLAGANSFQILFTSPSGNSTQLGSKTFTAATTVNDSLTVTFPRFSESGTWTVSAAIVGDAAGNTQILSASDLASRGPATLTVTSGPADTTPPTLTAFSFTPTTINVTGAPATVTLNFTMTDDIAGATDFQAVFISPSGVFVNASAHFASNTSFTGSATATFAKGSEDGTWTVASVLLGDAAGNTSNLATADLVALGFPTTLTVTNATGDTTPPVITPTVSPAPNAFGWNTTVPVTVSWSVSDPESGINSSSGCVTTTVSAETAGVTFTCSATNNNGLTSSVSVTVHIDLSPPIVTPSVSPSPNGAGWTNTDTTVSWSLNDSISGIDSESGCGVITLTAETAGTVITCTATNGAGLSQSASVTIKIDKTPPTAVAAAAPAPNGAGWNNTNVTVSFAGADALSGIAGCTAPITIGTEGAGQSASGICTDRAGNTSAVATFSGINIDKTAPVASNVVATPNPVPLNATTTLTATITDSLSGVASAAYNVDGGSFSPMSGTFGGTTASVSATTPAFTTTGAHTVCVRGTDVAGNVGATTCISLVAPVATVFVGLKNSDDQGTNFDVQVDMLRNGNVVASGLVRCVTGLVRTASSAKQVAIPFTSGNGVPAVSGDVVAFRVSARIGTNPDGTACGGHASAVGLDLYYDSTTQNSRFSPGIPMGTTSDFFLHTTGTTDLFDNTAPTSTTSKVKESGSVHFSGGNPFAVVGTWSRTQP